MAGPHELDGSRLLGRLGRMEVQRADQRRHGIWRTVGRNSPRRLPNLLRKCLRDPPTAWQQRRIAPYSHTGSLNTIVEADGSGDLVWGLELESKGLGTIFSVYPINFTYGEEQIAPFY